MSDKNTPIDPITHSDERVNIPTPELAPLMDPKDARPVKVAYDLRNPDLDPQLIWRGKDIDQAAVTADAPPIYLQEQVHPKAIIEDLRAGGKRNGEGGGASLFDHFGITEEDREAEIEFYRHSRKWSNRMILGDGLQVMASLAEREGLKGQVQAIYIDPPYGIKFNSNFQWSTTSRDVKDGNLAHLTREPEQVKAFRDTWRDGIHSYLQYLRDRLVVARELLTESGSCFVQIGDENVHRVRALMDEVFGDENFVSQINVRKTATPSILLDDNFFYVIWYSKIKGLTKVRTLVNDKPRDEWISDTRGGSWGLRYSECDYRPLQPSERRDPKTIPEGSVYALSKTNSAGPSQSDQRFVFQGTPYHPGRANHWKTAILGMGRLIMADRLETRGGPPWMRKFHEDSAFKRMTNAWLDTSGKSTERFYVVQTEQTVVERCLLMTTDPGDLVLDPTCGSGTTATVAEQWGRRWITIDTSRVALALARARIMGAKYPWYLLADSPEGQRREAEVTRSAPATSATYNDIRHGFVYNRVPHITLRSIANNTEIDEIWAQRQPAVEDARAALNVALNGFPLPHPVTSGGRSGTKIDFDTDVDVALPSGELAKSNEFLEWEIPREPGSPLSGKFLKYWSNAAELIGHAWTDKGKSIEVKGRFQRIGDFDVLDGEGQIRLHNEIGMLNQTLKASRNPPDFEFTIKNLLELPGSESGKPMIPWPRSAIDSLEAFWQARIARQKEIDASIAAKADFEFLYDKPFEDRKRVRVAGPFTVESLSPHRTQAVNEYGEIIDEADAASGKRSKDAQEAENYLTAILENLKQAGVQQGDKADKISFTTLTPGWGGEWIVAEGRYMEGDPDAGGGTERRAAIFIGPEYGTVQRADLVAAAREAADGGFDILIACAFNFDAHTAEFRKLGRVPVLHARMNPDLHMAGELKAGGGNLFVVFGEPDIEVVAEGDKFRVNLKGVDIFRPATGEVVSSEPDDIACWFIDTDYNEESFFVRHAYFPGADVPYKQLKTTLKGEVDEEAWESLKRTISRPFAKPKSGRIAVKVINHLGDEVMKVLGV